MSETSLQSLHPPYLHGEAAEEPLFGAIAEDLETRGYSIQPNALPIGVSEYLSARIHALEESDFAEAAVGRGVNSVQNRFVRQNKIHWAQDDHGENPWASWTDSLRTYLNRRLFLGLFSFESHFSRYDPGDFYRRHLDAFPGERNRIVSVVAYLNEGWLPDQGGELVLHHEDGSSTMVTPAAGTLVVFLSEEVPHEVLPTRRSRFGLAGWYRVNANLGEQLDPPR